MGSDVWCDLETLAAKGYEIMPSLAVRYAALVSHAEAKYATMDPGARDLMCAAAVQRTPMYRASAYAEWGVSAERRRLDEAALLRAQEKLSIVVCVAIARERGVACTSFARSLSSLPSGVLAMVGEAAAGV